MGRPKLETQAPVTRARRKVAVAQRRFAQLLTQILEKRQLRDAELARACGLSRESIRKFANGETQPTWHSVQLIAEALGVSVMELADLPARSEITGKKMTR